MTKSQIKTNIKVLKKLIKEYEQEPRMSLIAQASYASLLSSLEKNTILLNSLK